jgi:hypothetical protein
LSKTLASLFFGATCCGIELAAHIKQENKVRVVTIRNPPAALEGLVPDNLAVGKILDVSPHLAILMIAAGWVRGESRTWDRRQRETSSGFNRREFVERRSWDPA